MAISVAMIVFVPKLLTVEEYGKWQLYIFYCSYLGVLHFGWIDGIYLRYGGCYFEKLDKELFTGQYLLLFVFELIIALSGYVVLGAINLDINLEQILYVVGMVLVPTILFTFSNVLLQITNRIQDYAKLIIVERLVFVCLISACLAINFRNSIYIMCLDFVCKVVAALYGAWLIKDIFVKKVNKLRSILNEAWINVNVGSKLLLANLSGMLILGIVRFGIAYQWSVATFGKVSLILSVSNFVMAFINSLSVVLFPILKRIDVEKQCAIYGTIRLAMTMVMVSMLLMYYPLHYVLLWWLPKYAESMKYMALLFPIFLFESRVVLLTN
ncbi:lipopolysaccharide biosynthesis protein [Phascolarctobacterium sp.]|uniref:lipopolysaccharide biosynthesis protein n=1 Tax=Phascolarctobacterium sp. TaxID=2049039 RepID=UPI00386D9E82